MMLALLLSLQVIESSVGHYPVEPVVGMSGEDRTYHSVSVKDLPTTRFTHVSVCGQVTLVKHEDDGDWHLRISNGRAFIVAEIIPEMPLAVPKKGQKVKVSGISRQDKAHGWYEVHPVTAIGSCGM